MAVIDTSIPFAGRPPQIVNALALGSQAAAQRNELARANALAQLYQTQGADIAAGNQGALNALAQFDPMAALGVQDARQGMDARALQMDATRQTMDLQLRQWAATMDEQERAARLREGQDVMARIINATTPQAFDALMIEMGKPEMVGQFGRRGEMINNMRDPLDVLAQYDAQNAARQDFKLETKTQEAPTAQSAIAKLEADFRNGLINEEQYQIGMQNLAPTGMAVSVTPEGGVSFVQGPNAAGANMTEGQSRDTVYATRARAALEGLDGPTGTPEELTNWGQRALGAVPMDLGRYFQSPDYQVAEAQGQQFLAAVLRKDTGAAITRDEQIIYGDMFLPRPGDSAQVLEVKRQAREQAVIAIEAGMPPQAILAQANALMAAGVDSQPGTPIGGNQDAPQAMDFSSMSRDELARVDVLKMTQAELDAWNAALDALDTAGGQ